jgi:hypothetical protein
MRRLGPLTNARLNRASQDTAEGCRANAAADLVRAAETTGGMSKQRMLDSAAAWTARAELLERLRAASEAHVPIGPGRGRGRRKAPDLQDAGGGGSSDDLRRPASDR